MSRIPRRREDDYTAEAAAERRDFIRRQTGAELDHAGRFSFDPAAVAGNIENFSGVCQMPLGFAGPLSVRGEHARGEFYVPMATTEGTLVASYNRCMRLTREAGGVTATVIDDAMQRAPVFCFAEVLGCHGRGKVYKLAEIVAATVLCGELSLGGAILAGEWVASHEQYGRNR